MGPACDDHGNIGQVGDRARSRPVRRGKIAELAGRVIAPRLDRTITDQGQAVHVPARDGDAIEQPKGHAWNGKIIRDPGAELTRSVAPPHPNGPVACQRQTVIAASGDLHNIGARHSPGSGHQYAG